MLSISTDQNQQDPNISIRRLNTIEKIQMRSAEAYNCKEIVISRSGSDRPDIFRVSNELAEDTLRHVLASLNMYDRLVAAGKSTACAEWIVSQPGALSKLEAFSTLELYDCPDRDLIALTQSTKNPVSRMRI